MAGELTLKAILLGEDRSAGKSIKGVGKEADTTAGKLGKMSGKLGNLIGGDAGELLNKVSEGFDSAGEAAGKSSKVMMGVGTVAVGAGLAMQKMASGDIAAHQQLQAAVAATGKGYDGFGEDVDKLIEKQVKFGHTDGEVQDSLRVLTQAYGDPKKALDAMGMATDLAAAKHISLGEAAAMVGKAHGGSAKVFKEFGIVVGKNKDGTKDYDGALTTLSGKLSGQASASVDNFSGKLKQARAWTDNAASNLAEKYGPAVTTAGAALTGLGAVLELVKGKQIASTVASIAGRVATVATTVATSAWAAAQWLINAALTANPIGLVIAAIALLVAGLIYAYKHSETFRLVVQASFMAISAAAAWLWNNGIAPVIRFILRGFANVVAGIASFLHALGKIPGFGWAETAAKKMDTAARSARLMADGINDIPKHTDVKVVTAFINAHIDAFRTVADAHGSNVRAALRDIRGYASGTPSAKRGLALVGEEGPELMFMNGGEQIASARRTASMMGNGRSVSGGSSSGDQTISVNLHLDTQKVQTALLTLKRRNGGQALGLA